MELFTIERYEGDSFSTEENTDQESQHLAQLIEQARGRKRSREKSNLYKREDECTKKTGSLIDDASPKVAKNRKLERNACTKLPKSKEQFIEKDNNNRTCDHCDAFEKEEETFPDVESAGNNCSNTDKYFHDGKDLDHSKNTDKEDLSDKTETEKTHVLSESKEPQIEMTVIGGESKKKSPKTVRRALPKWLANPSFFSCDVNKNLQPVTDINGLHSALIQKLHKQGVEHFFPVQVSVIPAVLSSWERDSPYGRGGFMPQDICVCAPTGSGKTLTYVLPVIELLRKNVLQRLEALVIVPTKDLGTQVWNVFNMYAQSTGLSVGLANGLKSLQKEKELLGSNSCLGYSSNVNILVATPGRLVEHISNTDGFSLRFLRFFIIDEADRLLAEPYFGWLDKVYGSVYSTGNTQGLRSSSGILTPLKTERIQRPLQKLLFSATLTQNPEKLALLRLYMPRFFTVAKSESSDVGTEEINNDEDKAFDTHLRTPFTLEESMYICNRGGKPLVLLHLLTEQQLDGVLCFTSSIESTHRLYLLIKHFGEIGVQEFSSNLTAARRQTILNDFKCGQTQIIICSDAMARGLDVPAVKYVVSYDPPVSSKTYVHRVGRTARAGKTGTAITLLHDNEVFHFKKMLKSLKKGKIGKHSVKDHDLECLMDKYEAALEQLKTEVTSSKGQTKRLRR
ncbi:ATP-dependent RNA helicase DDX51-like [Dendronephthya gigantea]|uniref:ATP-dependent RNA helicase DDX51-like n=1 Tax=Dendronephthya gigantea TaxID=151771 RepID=UPI00106BA904|nr:ATP-dependent RNA helicase DDX51-like [Dendronephthya gigantea]